MCGAMRVPSVEVMEPLLSFHSVSKVYGHGAGEVRALDDVTVVVPRGGFTAVMGPSGSGKSTFMNVAAGLDDASAGEVYVDSQPLHALDDRARTVLRRTHVGFVFQSFNLVPTLDVRENVLPRATAGTGLSVHVGGTTASAIDFSDMIGKRLPLFIIAVLALSFLLLLMVFRSVLVPLKAVLMNLLSIGAAYGVMVAVFQWGWFG